MSGLNISMECLIQTITPDGSTDVSVRVADPPRQICSTWVVGNIRALEVGGSVLITRQPDTEYHVSVADRDGELIRAVEMIGTPEEIYEALRDAVQAIEEGETLSINLVGRAGPQPNHRAWRAGSDIPLQGWWRTILREVPDESPDRPT